MTQGNLSSHLSKLEAAGYIRITKGFSGKRPQTMIAMTTQGRNAFRSYVERMRSALWSIEQ